MLASNITKQCLSLLLEFRMLRYSYLFKPAWGGFCIHICIHMFMHTDLCFWFSHFEFLESIHILFICRNSCCTVKKTDSTDWLVFSQLIVLVFSTNYFLKLQSQAWQTHFSFQEVLIVISGE